MNPEMTRSDGSAEYADSDLQARRKRLENFNVQEALSAMEGEFNAALKLGSKDTSGLVEMQKWFAKIPDPRRTRPWS
jgi:hypothetical protein